MIETAFTVRTTFHRIRSSMGALGAAPTGMLPDGGKSACNQGLFEVYRKKRTAGKVLFLITLAFVLASCVSIPRPASDDEVYSAPSLNGYDYFWYYSTADPFLPLKSEKAEIIRLERFRKWLTRNGYESPTLEVVSRRIERKKKTLWMTVYEIKYLIKVKQPAEKEEGSEAEVPEKDRVQD